MSSTAGRREFHFESIHERAAYERGFTDHSRDCLVDLALYGTILGVKVREWNSWGVHMGYRSLTAEVHR